MHGFWLLLFDFFSVQFGWVINIHNIYDFKVDISTTHVCILMQEWCFNFKKQKLDFIGHLQRISKAISSQNVSCRFQSCCWTAIQKMKFCVKESNNLVGLENLGP